MSNAARTVSPLPASKGPSLEPSLRIQRPCACGGTEKLGLRGECQDCSTRKLLGLQARSEAGAGGDRFELEADRTADHVMAVTSDAADSAMPLSLQRVSTQAGGLGEAPLAVRQALASPGRALDSDTRSFFESRFGHDLSRVRIHHSAAAQASATALGARAYTVGNDMAFAAGQFAPHTRQGRHLIAHELTHVVQQSGAATLQKKAAATPTSQAKPASKVYAAMPLEEAIQHLAEMPPDQALLVLKSYQQYLIRSISSGEARTRAQIELRAESLGNYLIGGAIEVFGGTSLPTDDWDDAWRGVNAAYGAIKRADLKAAHAQLRVAAEATLHHWEQLDQYFAKTDRGAERAVTTLKGIVLAAAATEVVLAAPAVMLAAPEIAAAAKAVPLALALSTAPVAIDAAAVAVPAVVEASALTAPLAAAAIPAALETATLAAPAAAAAPALLETTLAAAAPALGASAPLTAAAAAAPGAAVLAPAAATAAATAPAAASSAATLTAAVAVAATTLASDGKTPATITKPPADDQQPKCSLPTGKTPADPIPFQWFKPRHDFYPRSVTIGGNVYERDDPGPHRLPVVDEPFGVAAEQWAHKGKLVQLKHWYRPFPSASDKYRTWINLANGGASLSRAGFQVDHVQDPQWGLPNGDLGGEELDAWWNLWPLGSQWNMGIAGYQNNLQTVSFCEGPNGPQRLKVPISQLKAEGRYGLFFVITEVSPIWRG